jgi:hypothetical protein
LQVNPEDESVLFGPRRHRASIACASAIDAQPVAHWLIH